MPMGDLSANEQQQRAALEAQRKEIERFHMVVGSVVMCGGSGFRVPQKRGIFCLNSEASGECRVYISPFDTARRVAPRLSQRGGPSSTMGG